MSAQRDDEAVQQQAEQFGNLLADTGWPRMSARVFAAILASEKGRLTAAELSEQLQASPAAVSGAVRYLLQMRLASREREPGSRRDVYVVQDDFWYESMMRQDRYLIRWEEILGRLAESTGTGTEANRRVLGTLGFLEFIQEEVEGLSERWIKRKAEIDAKLDADFGR
ncbi:DNA-binding transcriptional regulator GbsR (MarR family) [Kribbella amoyensis]|uniref:DNA-binding transcriptional regulator GbsR (MarR family) n=1 Tax=Kribbella amoyensis TaxID=996641 RepID=A0A561B7Q1_9ACTN|nr:MarR family transcriptional regulator [Kribbella amoyensis]TWD74996.1 DNA-binding transcriptional regulator GbsR (MarR family) [Kribbella amoyensis]